MAMKKQYTLDALKKLSREKLYFVCKSRDIVVDEYDDDEKIRGLILEDQFNIDTKETRTFKDKGESKEPDKSDKEPKQEPTLKNKNGNDRIWFKVMAGSQSHEKQDVFAALNGESILIKRNHWVKLKTKFLPVFQDAIQTEVYIEDDEAKLRHVPRFNFITRSIEEGLPDNERR